MNARPGPGPVQALVKPAHITHDMWWYSIRRPLCLYSLLNKTVSRIFVDRVLDFWVDKVVRYNPFYIIWEVLFANARWFSTSWGTYIFIMHAHICILFAMIYSYQTKYSKVYPHFTYLWWNISLRHRPKWRRRQSDLSLYPTHVWLVEGNPCVCACVLNATPCTSRLCFPERDGSKKWCLTFGRKKVLKIRMADSTFICN